MAGIVQQSIQRFLGRHLCGWNTSFKTAVEPISELAVNAAGLELSLKTRVDYSTSRKRVEIYKDQAGRVFIYPDFEKGFSTVIRTYSLADTMSTEDILSRAQQIASIPGTDRFIFVLDFGKRVYVIDTEGKWHDPTQNYGDKEKDGKWGFFDLMNGKVYIPLPLMTACRAIAG